MRRRGICKCASVCRRRRDGSGICKCASVCRRRRDGSSRKYAKEAKNPLTRLCRGLSQRESLNLSRKALKEKGLTLSSVAAGTKALHNQNTLTFELKVLPFTAITLTGQRIPALNFSREFLRDLLGCGASQAGLAERGDLKLLSFVLSFQKRKYIKKRLLQKAPSRRSLQGCFARLQIFLKEEC